MATDTGKGLWHWLNDDFNGDTINLDLYVTNADAGGTAFAINTQHNGVIRGSVGTTDGEITNIYTPPQVRADAGGPLTLEVRARLITSIADGETYIGFSDAATDENPMTVSTTDALTSTASNAAGFAYTGGGTADWKAVSVNDDGDGTVTRCNNGGATTPVAGTWQTFKVVINQDGDADFYIDGIWQYREDAAVSASTLLNFFAALQSGGTARSLELDYGDGWAGRR